MWYNVGSSQCIYSDSCSDKYVTCGQNEALCASHCQTCNKCSFLNGSVPLKFDVDSLFSHHKNWQLQAMKIFHVVWHISRLDVDSSVKFHIFVFPDFFIAKILHNMKKNKLWENFILCETVRLDIDDSPCHTLNNSPHSNENIDFFSFTHSPSVADFQSILEDWHLSNL